MRSPSFFYPTSDTPLSISFIRHAIYPSLHSTRAFPLHTLTCSVYSRPTIIPFHRIPPSSQTIPWVRSRFFVSFPPSISCNIVSPLSTSRHAFPPAIYHIGKEEMSALPVQILKTPSLNLARQSSCLKACPACGKARARAPFHTRRVRVPPHTQSFEFRCDQFALALNHHHRTRE
jgi:hypothetical protein